jgi:hypothetical protein
MSGGPPVAGMSDAEKTGCVTSIVEALRHRRLPDTMSDEKITQDVVRTPKMLFNPGFDSSVPRDRVARSPRLDPERIEAIRLCGTRRTTWSRA